MNNKTRRTHSPEFKREAVALAGRTITGVASNLGIGAGLIQRWKRAQSRHGRKAFVGQDVARDEEMMTLRRELAQVKKDRDSPKSAAAYFAKEGK